MPHVYHNVHIMSNIDIIVGKTYCTLPILTILDFWYVSYLVFALLLQLSGSIVYA